MSTERVYIKCGNTRLETFRAIRAWAEQVAAQRGRKLDPAWYKDGPEDRPGLYDHPPVADAEGQAEADGGAEADGPAPTEDGTP